MVDGQFIFQTAGHGSPEAETFVLLMRLLEAFSGVRVLTYALMSNHFHLLCEVPQAQELSEVELFERIQAGYGPALLPSPLARLRTQTSCTRDPSSILLSDLSLFILGCAIPGERER